MAEGNANPQKKTYTNKNIKKLRTVSLVCGLTSSWQRWVSDNETKQAKEPSGWAPSWLDPDTEPKKTWTPKKIEEDQTTEDDKERDGSTLDGSVAIESSTKTSNNKGGGEIEEPIKTKEVEKTITSAATEKSITIVSDKELLPSNDQIDKLLKTGNSPTPRSWKQEEGAVDDGQILNSDDCKYEAKDQRKREETRGTEQDEEEEEDKEEEEEEESVMKIKRPSSLLLKKESDDANKINALSKRYSAVGSLKSRWQDWASEHTVNQRLNPFSEYFDYNYSMSTRLVRGQEGYGRPKEGTKTAERAKRAEQHIHREIADMCLIIRTMAKPDGDGKTRVTFGELFDRYVRISDKVVGILMRARKHGKVAFEGEMLWQGRDDGVIITLLV
ncbi:unnamed protein product [Knipowitschia caucasica]|uniref:Actin-binding Rho-activating protein n=1 Tax=Knipowitschia caucasica TaxID=637954 RepID=A0AAV2K0Z0_KNICA